MCNYKTLYKNEHGYVVKCNHCKNLHVAFGNTLLAFSKDEFYEFARSIAECYQDNQFVCCRQEKRVQVPTANHSVTLVFSIDELDHFRKILKAGSDALHRETLFDFNFN